MPEFSQIKETILYISDLDLAEGFYHGKLGLPMIGKAEGQYVFFRAGSSVLLCFIPEVSRVKQNLPSHFGGGNQHFAFECLPGTYQEWKEFILKRKIEITHEQVWSSGHRSFYFEDPEQNVLEIVEPGMWEH